MEHNFSASKTIPGDGLEDADGLGAGAADSKEGISLDAVTDGLPGCAFGAILISSSMFAGKYDFLFSPGFTCLDIFGFFGKYKNARAEISRKTHRRMPRDLSYETHSGPKTNTENRQFSRPLKRI